MWKADSTECSSKENNHLPFKDRQPMRSASDLSNQTVSDPASQLYNQGLNSRRAVFSPAAFASLPARTAWLPSPLTPQHTACARALSVSLPCSCTCLSCTPWHRSSVSAAGEGSHPGRGIWHALGGKAVPCFGVGRWTSRSTAVQNPELPLTVNTKQQKQQEHNLHQINPGLSHETGDPGWTRN